MLYIIDKFYCRCKKQIMFSCLNHLLKLCLHLFDIAAGENGNEPVYLIDVLIPPFKARKQPDRLIVKAPPQQPCRVSGNDGIGFDVAADHTVCADYRAVADMDAGEDNGVHTSFPTTVSPLNGSSPSSGANFSQPPPMMLNG